MFWPCGEAQHHSFLGLMSFLLHHKIIPVSLQPQKQAKCKLRVAGLSPGVRQKRTSFNHNLLSCGGCSSRSSTFKVSLVPYLVCPLYIESIIQNTIQCCNGELVFCLLWKRTTFTWSDVHLERSIVYRYVATFHNFLKWNNQKVVQHLVFFMFEVDNTPKDGHLFIQPRELKRHWQKRNWKDEEKCKEEKSPPLWGSKFLGGKASDWSRNQNPAFWLVQRPSAP